MTTTSDKPSGCGATPQREGRIPELEQTRINADCWLAEAKHDNVEHSSAVIFFEQAINAWKNAAYAAHDALADAKVDAAKFEKQRAELERLLERGVTLSANVPARTFTICEDHKDADWNQPAIEDVDCILCRLFYLEAQESLLEEWQQRAKKAEDTIAEIHRPLDAQMARLNETVTRLNEENERLRSQSATLPAWHYGNPPRDEKDCRRLVSMEDGGMQWVGIRAWNHERQCWMNGGEVESQTVVAWAWLPEPAWLQGSTADSSDRKRSDIHGHAE